MVIGSQINYKIKARNNKVTKRETMRVAPVCVCAINMTIKMRFKYHCNTIILQESFKLVLNVFMYIFRFEVVSTVYNAK